MRTLIILLFICSSSYAQEKEIRSSLNQVSIPVSSNAELSTMIELCEILYDAQHLEAISAPDGLEEKFLSAIKYADRNSDEVIVFKLKIALAKYYWHHRKYKQLIEQIPSLQDYANRHEIPEEKHMIRLLFEFYARMEFFEEMLNLIPELDRLTEKYGAFRNSIFSLDYDLAMIHFKLRNYEEAIKGFSKQEAIFSENGDQLFKASMINNIGLCHFKLGEYDEARKQYKRAIHELSIPSPPSELDPIKRHPEYNQYFEDVILSNIAEIDLKNGKYIEADKAFKRLLRWKEIVLERQTYVDAYCDIAETYFLRGDPENTLRYINLAFAEEIILDLPEARIRAYGLKAKSYLLLDNQTKANTFFQRQQQLDDSLKQVRIKRKHLFASTRFQTEEKQREIEQLRSDTLVQSRTINYQFIGLILISVFFLIMISFYVILRRNRKKINEQNESLEAALKEKNILLKEIHHRVKNNLQIISGILQLQGTKLATEQPETVFRESQQYIQSIAMAHEMLYQSDRYDSIESRSYMRKLVDAVMGNSLMADHDITIDIDEKVKIEMNHVVSLGLIINELLINSNKHAFLDGAGQITIRLAQLGSDYRFEYSDNGKGLPADFQLSTSDKLGLKLVEMLSEEMNGHFQLGNTEGFSCFIQFKPIADEE
ncbi:MAG: histidine kinase dimerization/phosphoacceptor domain -containing protein [Crocinitomicaceae bacterium]